MAVFWLLDGGPTAAQENPPSPSEGGLEDIPPSTPHEAAQALIEALVGRVPDKYRAKIEKLLSEHLVVPLEYGYMVSFPVDIQGTLTTGEFADLATAVSEATGVPVSLHMEAVGKYPFAFASYGSGQPVATSFGGLLDLIVSSIISASVGTVASMGVESGVRSLGGEKRLARIMRHYRSAVQHGQQARAEQIKAKVLRTASRIKGRQVNWSEIEALSSGS